MKNSNKISEKSEKNRGWLVMVLGGGVLFSGSSVHIQIWKHLQFWMEIAKIIIIKS